MGPRHGRDLTRHKAGYGGSALREASVTRVDCTRLLDHARGSWTMPDPYRWPPNFCCVIFRHLPKPSSLERDGKPDKPGKSLSPNWTRPAQSRTALHWPPSSVNPHSGTFLSRGLPIPRTAVPRGKPPYASKMPLSGPGAGDMTDGEDATAHASLSRRIDLTVMADSFVLGWKEAILIELDGMRREMPYADTLELHLICERRRDP